MKRKSEDQAASGAKRKPRSLDELIAEIEEQAHQQVTESIDAETWKRIKAKVQEGAREYEREQKKHGIG
jgi:hypothetical protein